MDKNQSRSGVGAQIPLDGVYGRVELIRSAGLIGVDSESTTSFQKAAPEANPEKESHAPADLPTASYPIKT